MLGYWLIVAMTLTALAGVIIVVASSSLEEPAPMENSIRIAVLGASDVTGDGLVDPQRENWVGRLTETLPADVTIRSFGIGGAWLASAMASQVPQAAAWSPSIVICWLVVNDLTQGERLETFAPQLDAMLDRFEDMGSHVILGNCPQIWSLPAFAGSGEDLIELQTEVARWNAELDVIALRHHATVVDLGAEPTSPDDVLPDGFHPNPGGHARLAAAFAPAVLAAIDRVRTLQFNPATIGTRQP